jgi:hypothetical protein
MTKEQQAESAECCKLIEAGLRGAPAGITRDCGFAALARLQQLLDEGHAAASHAPKRARRARKARAEEPARETA